MLRTRARVTLATVAAIGCCCSPAAASATTSVPPDVPPHSLKPLLIPAPGVAQPSASGKTRLLVIGDSLTQSMPTGLPQMLPGWRIGVNGVGGRPLAEGMAWLRTYKLPAKGRTILAMSLFTDDRPTRVAQLKAAVRESLRRVGPHGCAIWATVYRRTEAFGGTGYGRANDVLRALAAKHRDTMRLVPWAAVVRGSGMPIVEETHPATAAGWELRAKLFADAARTC
jgi:hypothetical protein